jgi:ribosome-binding factor A
MASRRTMRLGSQIKEVLSMILLQEVRDPGIGFVTVTDVVVTPDLKRAKVYVSIMGSEADKTRALESLQRAAKFIRRKLGERLSLRFVPEVAFYLDTSIDYGERIDRLLDEINASKPKPD